MGRLGRSSRGKRDMICKRKYMCVTNDDAYDSDDDANDSDDETDVSSASKMSGKRGATLMKELHEKRARGEKVKVEFDGYLEPVGDASDTWRSYLGLVGRSKIGICHESWRQVDVQVKYNIWEDIMAVFDFQSTEALKKKWIKYIGARWKDFKAKLTNRFIYGELKNKDASEVYNFITANEWAKFKKSRENPKFQEQRALNQERQAHNKYKHRLSRGGYKKLDKKLMEEKYAKKRQEALDSGMTEEEANNISPPSPINRHERWVRARVNPDGQYMTDEIEMVAEKIGSLTQQVSEGEFIPSGRNDILTVALGKEEHPGRVRGVCSRMGIRQMFGTSVGDNHQECKQLISQLQSQMQAQMSHLYARLGVQPLELPHTHAPSHSSVQVPLEPQPLSKKIVEKADLFEDFGDGTKCSLFVEDAQRHVVAHGRISNIDRDHFKILPTGTVKVIVDVLVDGDALVPYPDDEVVKVRQAKGSLLVWPKNLIELGRTDEVDHGGEKRKDILEMACSSKTKESMVEGPFLEDTSTLPKSCKQLHGLMQYFLSTKIITVHMDKDIVGVEYDILMCKEDVMQLLAMKELNLSIIQVYMKVLYDMNINKKDRFNAYGYLCPSSIQKVGTDGKEVKRSTYIAEVMNASKKKYYLAPFHESCHWMLSVICPATNTVYWFDPEGNPPKDDFMKVVELAMTTYHILGGRRAQQQKLIRWISLNYHIQMDHKGSGFYVMQYMEEVVKMRKIDMDLVKCFPEDHSPYSQGKLDEVREKWARYFVNSVLLKL